MLARKAAGSYNADIMPELPEVETMKRGISAVVGCRIGAVERPACRLRPIEISPRVTSFRRHAVGKAIISLGRIGKRVLVHLDSGYAIVFEPRMTGLILLVSPPDLDHLRFRLVLTGGDAEELLFWDRRGLGSVRLVSPTEMEQRFGPEQVGPDALTLTGKLLKSQIGDSRRAIKVALLDQRAVAGIGNLYASEILHLAEIHPARRCDQLARVQWERLAECTLEVLEMAIRHEGSTLSDGTYRNALNESGSYQNHHRVYDRADMPCLRCQTLVVRFVQAQRSTFYCPTCQPDRCKRSRHRL